jgi:hypothetical protein
VEPEDRPTKRERREHARRERRQREESQEREGRTRRVLIIAGTIAAVLAIAAVVWFTREEPAETGIAIEPAAAAEAAEMLACDRPDIEPPTTTAHIAEEGAPQPEDLYEGRPTHGGPHFANVSPIRITDEPLDERLTTHNLEHGAVVVWYDPDEASAEDVAAAEDWAGERNRGGFQQRAGTGILVSPYPEQPLPTGGVFAFRAWLAAVDRDGFDPDAADAFLALHYGSAGQAPEAFFSPYPEDVLVFAAPPDEDPFTGRPIGEVDPDGEPQENGPGMGEPEQDGEED